MVLNRNTPQSWELNLSWLPHTRHMPYPLEYGTSTSPLYPLAAAFNRGTSNKSSSKELMRGTGRGKSPAATDHCLRAGAKSVYVLLAVFLHIHKTMFQSSGGSPKLKKMLANLQLGAQDPGAICNGKMWLLLQGFSGRESCQFWKNNLLSRVAPNRSV